MPHKADINRLTLRAQVCKMTGEPTKSRRDPSMKRKGVSLKCWATDDDYGTAQLNKHGRLEVVVVTC